MTGSDLLVKAGGKTLEALQERASSLAEPAGDRQFVIMAPGSMGDFNPHAEVAVVLAKLGFEVEFHMSKTTGYQDIVNRLEAAGITVYRDLAMSMAELNQNLDGSSAQRMVNDGIPYMKELIEDVVRVLARHIHTSGADQPKLTLIFNQVVAVVAGRLFGEMVDTFVIDTMIGMPADWSVPHSLAEEKKVDKLLTPAMTHASLRFLTQTAMVTSGVYETYQAALQANGLWDAAEVKEAFGKIEAMRNADSFRRGFNVAFLAAGSQTDAWVCGQNPEGKPLFELQSVSPTTSEYVADSPEALEMRAFARTAVEDSSGYLILASLSTGFVVGQGFSTLQKMLAKIEALAQRKGTPIYVIVDNAHGMTQDEVERLQSHLKENGNDRVYIAPGKVDLRVALPLSDVVICSGGQGFTSQMGTLMSEGSAALVMPYTDEQSRGTRTNIKRISTVVLPILSKELKKPSMSGEKYIERYFAKGLEKALGALDSSADRAAVRRRQFERLDAIIHEYNERNWQAIYFIANTILHDLCAEKHPALEAGQPSGR